MFDWFIKTDQMFLTGFIPYLKKEIGITFLA